MDEQAKKIAGQIRNLEDSFCNPRKLREAEDLRQELKDRGYSEREIREACDEDA